MHSEMIFIDIIEKSLNLSVCKRIRPLLTQNIVLKGKKVVTYQTL